MMIAVPINILMLLLKQSDLHSAEMRLHDHMERMKKDLREEIQRQSSQCKKVKRLR